MLPSYPNSTESLPNYPSAPESLRLGVEKGNNSDRTVPHRIRFRTLSGRFSISPMGLVDTGISRKGAETSENREPNRKLLRLNQVYEDKLKATGLQDLDTRLRNLPPRADDRAADRLKAIATQNLPNHGRKRSPRGSNGLTKLNKELIEDGLVLLYNLVRVLGLNLVFWTVTTPTRYKDGSPLTIADQDRILANWHTVNKRICEELDRLLVHPDKALPKRHLYVNEIQEKRWERQGVLSMHMHILFPNKSLGGKWLVTTAELDNIIERVFSNLLGKPVDCSSAGNTERVGKTHKLTHYLVKFGKLGKYMSKGGKVLGAVKGSRYASLLPKSWCGADLQTKQQVRASVKTMSIRAENLNDARLSLEKLSLEFQLENDRPLFTGLYTVPSRDEDNPFPVAVTGRVGWLSDIETALTWLAFTSIDTLYYAVT